MTFKEKRETNRMLVSTISFFKYKLCMHLLQSVVMKTFWISTWCKPFREICGCLNYASDVYNSNFKGNAGTFVEWERSKLYLVAILLLNLDENIYLEMFASVEFLIVSFVNLKSYYLFENLINYCTLL